MFFSSYILPIFDYADIIWGDRGNVALMNQLHVPQNKVAHVILYLSPRTSATEARNKRGWKLPSRRRAEHRATFMFKSLNNSFNIVLNREHHDCNTRSKDDVQKAFSNRN